MSVAASEIIGSTERLSEFRSEWADLVRILTPATPCEIRHFPQVRSQPDRFVVRVCCFGRALGPSSSVSSGRRGSFQLSQVCHQIAKFFARELRKIRHGGSWLQ